MIGGKISDYSKGSVRATRSTVLRMDTDRVGILGDVIRYGMLPLGSEDSPARYALDSGFIEAVSRRGPRSLYGITELGQQVLDLCARGYTELEHAGMEAVRDERGRRTLRHVLRPVQAEAA